MLIESYSMSQKIDNLFDRITESTTKSFSSKSTKCDYNLLISNNYRKLCKYKETPSYLKYFFRKQINMVCLNSDYNKQTYRNYLNDNKIKNNFDN